MLFLKNIFNWKQKTFSDKKKENSFAEDEQKFFRKKVVIGVDDSGNPVKEERQISLHFKTENGYINVENPFRNIGIFGTGKSKALIGSLIMQMIQQKFTGLVYESSDNYNNPLFWSHIDSQKSEFYEINFRQLTLDMLRFNPLHPSQIRQTGVANRYTELLLNIFLCEEDNHFSKVQYDAYLSAIIWYLREEYPEYCTLPHLWSLVVYGNPYDIILMLNKNPWCAMRLSGLGAGPSISVIGELQTNLAKSLSKELFWILSGEDFILDFNNPSSPKWIFLKDDLNDEIKQKYSSFIISVAATQATFMDKLPYSLIIDGIRNLSSVLSNLQEAMVFRHNGAVVARGDYHDTLGLSHLGNLFLGQEFNQEFIDHIIEISNWRGVTILHEDITESPIGKFWVKTTDSVIFDKIILDEHEQLALASSNTTQDTQELISQKELDENFDRIKKEALSLI